ncbi:uncharacterized, partial [Tachysurus ichikawai]
MSTSFEHLQPVCDQSGAPTHARGHDMAVQIIQLCQGTNSVANYAVELICQDFKLPDVSPENRQCRLCIRLYLYCGQAGHCCTACPEKATPCRTK